MLLQVPLEILRHILSFTSRTTILVCRVVCHRLQVIVAPLLLSKVHLRNMIHVRDLFSTPMMLIFPAVSVGAQLFAERREQEWLAIKDLFLDLGLPYNRKPFGPILRNLRAHPLQLKILRISYRSNPIEFFDLLRGFNPTKVFILYTHSIGGDMLADRKDALKPSNTPLGLVQRVRHWDRLRSLNIALYTPVLPPTAQSPSYPLITSARFHFNPSPLNASTNEEYLAYFRAFLTQAPSLRSLRIGLPTDSALVNSVQEMLQESGRDWELLEVYPVVYEEERHYKFPQHWP